MPCLQAGCSLAELAHGHPTLQHPQAHQLGAVGGVGGCEGGTQPLTRGHQGSRRPTASMDVTRLWLKECVFPEA